MKKPDVENLLVSLFKEERTNFYNFKKNRAAAILGAFEKSLSVPGFVFDFGSDQE